MLDLKIKVILGENWKVSYHEHTELIGDQTCLVLISPEQMKILTKNQLLNYCKLKDIDKKKIDSIHFKLWSFPPNFKSNTFVVIGS